MPLRSRSYVDHSNKGYFDWHDGVNFGGDFPILDSKGTCSDITGHGDCEPLDINKFEFQGGRINGENATGGSFRDYRADILDNPAIWDHLALPDGIPNDVAFATDAVARTNPSKSLVDMAANLLELADITDLIRKRGWDFLLKIARFNSYRNRYGYARAIKIFGDINLTYQFGILPLVGDLVKLSEFKDQFDRRVRAIKKLASPKGLRRTVDMGRYSSTEQYNAVAQSNWGVVIHTTIHARTNQQVRVHCRWNTDEPPENLLNGPNLRALVTRSLVNYDLDAAALWEAIPWSWLIDWCSNVGTYFKATRNIVPAYLTGVHVMRHTKTEHHSPLYVDREIRMEPFIVKLESKVRRPSFVFPVAQFPFLNGTQMGILASLAVTRAG